ncbi:Hypothetical predicted protein [Octopus vulgaris]|uniref:Uncharacterized protein n=1 Tax=Octopus vulgaris TaxID=6645 RepID=A0AA36FJ91_OCTVU|nr:Hypothetical predicted protein [Octopus vulgaris]
MLSWTQGTTYSCTQARANLSIIQSRKNAFAHYKSKHFKPPLIHTTHVFFLPWPHIYSFTTYRPYSNSGLVLNVVSVSVKEQHKWGLKFTTAVSVAFYRCIYKLA